MAEALTQDSRLLAIDTPLGKDVLLLESFTGSEAVSQLFHFDVNLLADRENSNDAKVDAKQLLGNAVTLSVTLAGGKKRYINGIVRRFRKAEVSQRFASFSAEVVPLLWLLSLQADCRIFQGKTIPEVIEQILKGGGVKFKMNLIGKYDPVDYCVQYRETGLNFVCRLMEEVGINYWFDHTDTDHTMVLGDAPSAHKDCPNQDKVYLDSQAGSTDEDYISSWEERQELSVGKWRLKDLNMEMPRNTNEVKATTTAATKPPAGLEVFDYPGGFAKRKNKTGERLGEIKDDGDKMVALRMEESDASLVLVDASSNCRALVPGFKINVDSRTLQPAAGGYVLTSVQHSVRQSPDYTGSDSGSGDYSNDFACVPASTKLRPPRETPKPVVMGLQNAVVVDSNMGQDDEISPDKYGRVKVIFPWDSEGAASAWLRVAQVRAGKSGGQIWIPRGTDEVLVAFMEGDPDCPIVVGSVYNADNMPPYALPANKTQSGIKTRSSAKGGADDYNELRFEDKKDAEEILLHAQKVLKVEVEADEFRTVGNERTTIIQKTDRRNNKEGDEKVHIEKGSWYRGINKDMLTTVEEGSYEVTIQQGHALTVLETGDHTLHVMTANNILKVDTGDCTTSVDQGNRSVSIGMGNDDLKIDMGNYSIKVGMGNITTKADLGKISTEAMQGIELKCGQSSIKIDQTGVTIKGMMVSIEGQIQTEVKGLMTSVKGSAMLQAQGAITMIG
ncbi:MAG: type VI secretion system tip protein TssI/VgrG [Gemmatimonadota bacterium]